MLVVSAPCVITVILHLCLSSSFHLLILHCTDCKVLEKLTGIHVRWECALEVEFDKRKREWLKHFTVPDILCADVSEVGEGDGKCWNFMTGEEAQLPEHLEV